MRRNRIIIVLVLLVLIFIIGYGIYPIYQSLTDVYNISRIKEFIENIGFFGVFVLLIIQILQVFIAIIPGEPIEVLAGVMYGTYFGAILCLIGIVIANTIIFYFSRKYGIEHLKKTKLYNKVYNHELLKNPLKLERLIFILYLIPGTPKDILAYVCAFSKVRFKDFIILSTLARVPSIITSTLAGTNIINGNIKFTIIIFTITLILGLMGINYQIKKND